MPSIRSDRLQDFTNSSIAISVLLAALFIIPFYISDDLIRGRLASYSVFCVYLITYATWKMRDKAWYFPVMAAILAIHLILAFAIPAYVLSGLLITLFPLAAFDIFGTIHLLNKFDQR